MEDSPAARPARRRAATPPQRQQIMLRRGLALGGGLILLILIVLGVKGCLNARKERALSDYARNVTQIVEETEQTSKAFFGRLSDPGSLSVTEFVAEVNADRSAMDNYASRDRRPRRAGRHEPRPGGARADLRPAQQRDDRNRRQDEHRARRRRLRESDRRDRPPDAEAAGERRGLRHRRATRNQQRARRQRDRGRATCRRASSCPTRPSGSTKTRSARRSASVSGSSGGETSGVHGLGLIGTSVNGTELVADATAAVAGEETPEVEVEVQNQGESTENGVTVSVTFGGTTVEQTVSSIDAGETQTVAIPLTPAPSGEPPPSKSRSSRSPASRSPTTTKPATRSNSNDRRRWARSKASVRRHREMRIAYLGPAGTFTEDALREAAAAARLRAAAHADRPRRDPRRRAAARPSGRWSPSRTRSRARCGALSTRSPSRPRR